MSKSTVILFLLLFAVLLSFLTLHYAFSHNLPFASSLLDRLLDNKTKQTAPLQKDVQKKLSLENVLYLSPNVQNIQEGRSNYVNVILDFKGASPTLAQLEISFDPKVLTNIDIVPGNFFINQKILLKNIDYNNGRISYALESTSSENVPSSQNPVAIISFMKSAGAIQKETALDFLPKTTIKIKGDTGTLNATYGAKIFLSPKKTQQPPLDITGSIFYR